MERLDPSALIASKHRAIQLLTRTALDLPGLVKAPGALLQYCRAVKSNPESHCLWDVLAVLRFLRHAEAGRFDPTPLRMFEIFYERLWLPGVTGLRHYALTPVQMFQMANIYGLRRPDGRRLTRQACLYVPRKFSKTTQSAAIILNDLLFGDSNSESYVGANSQDQAKKCFDVIREALRRLDPAGKMYRINEQVIKSMRRDRQSLAQCLTANARTKDGLNASTVVMDEFSQARDNRLLTVLTTSMGVRREPLTVIITTASDVFDGPFYSMLQGYKEMLLDTLDDPDVSPGIFAHLFEPDPGDAEDDPATWRKVHPHLGVTVSEEFYRDEYASALRNGSEAMMAFRTKLLNVYSSDLRASWISADDVRRAMAPVDPKKFVGQPMAMLAIDLSERDDFSAVSGQVWDAKSGRVAFFTNYFFPEGALPGHPNEQLYRAWASEGYLTLTPGPVVDYRVIVDHILSLVPHLHIYGVGYDGWKSKEMINLLANVGADLGFQDVLKPIPQTYGHYTAAVQSFEHGLLTGKVTIDDNPITAYCFGNAVLDFDSLDNCKPIKRRHAQKIDGVITMLMCYKQFLDFVG